MMTEKGGLKKIGISGLVSDNREEFKRGLRLLEDHFHNPINNELRFMWLDCFVNEKMKTWVETIQYCIANFDHFPLPIEIRRVIENIDKEKLKIISGDQVTPPKAFLPEKAADYSSEEYHQANMEFIQTLISGLNQCLGFKNGKGKNKEQRKEIWEDTEAKVTVLQDKYQHLPSSYSCTECWDSGWYSRQEGNYTSLYPCKCGNGFARQKEIILSALSEKARHTKQTLPQYLSSLTSTPFKVKAYPCIAVFDSQGKWDFECQHHCDPERIKWCFLQINVITQGKEDKP